MFPLIGYREKGWGKENVATFMGCQDPIKPKPGDSNVVIQNCTATNSNVNAKD